MNGKRVLYRSECLCFDRGRHVHKRKYNNVIPISQQKLNAITVIIIHKAHRNPITMFGTIVNGMPTESGSSRINFRHLVIMSVQCGNTTQCLAHWHVQLSSQEIPSVIAVSIQEIIYTLTAGVNAGRICTG